MASRGRTESTGKAARDRAGTRRGRGAPRRNGEDVPRAAPKVSRHARPEGLTPEEWQRELRRQFGAIQPFEMENVGKARVFSDYLVTNPASRRTYRVAIRGEEPGVSYCSCPDFATNLLGTCKHVEFVLASLRGPRGTARALRAGFRPSYSSVSLVYGARRGVRLRLAGGAPTALRRLAARLFDADGWLTEEGFGRFSGFRDEAARFPHELRVYEDVSRFVASVNADAQRRALIDRAFPDGIQSAAFEGLLRTPLPPYQREGALFACRAGRAILADEMGLGKTVQAIAVAEIGARYLGVERVLVVCPASLKHQWQDEVGRFSTRSVTVVSGGRPARAAAFAAPSFVKVMGYDTVHNDLDLIEGFSPQLVILDEAQRIKNWGTRVARSVKRIASPLALVLTGTPLENRIEELISIVQFIDQHRLGPTWRVLHDHQQYEEGTTRVVGYRDLDRLGETLAPVLLRRRKAEVLTQLPERTQKRLFVPLTEEQRVLHEENREMVARLVAKWRRFKFLSDADQKRLTIALQNMRMACDDVHLLDEKRRSGRKADEVAALLADLLATEGIKVVVFSQWVRMHGLLAERIEAAGWGHAFLHGGIPSGDRGALVRGFRDDPACRVFLSTDAGGTGLNLQVASVVVNVDLPWNPAVLEQRIGRVHRMGQMRPVQVFDLVAEASIEHGMLGLLGFKRALFAGVLDGGDPEILLGGTRLARFMESVGAVAERIPEAPREEPAGEEGLPQEAAADVPPESLAEAPASGPEEPPVETPRAAPEAPREEAPAAAPPAAAATGPGASGPPAGLALAGLLRAGASLLGQLAAAADAPGTGEAGSSGVTFERDVATGKTVLRVDLPDPDAFLAALRALARAAGG